MAMNKDTTPDRIILLKQGLETAFVDAVNETDLAYKPEFIINNYKTGQKVLTSIDRELLDCNSFAISVAFITKSGLTPLLQTLKELERRKISGRVLTTDYLMFSEPDALETLESLTNLEVRVFRTENGPGFHTKGYIFEKEGFYRIILGSANMTQSALTVNQEWNTKIVSTERGEFAKSVQAEFEQLWVSGNTLKYSDYRELYRTKYETIQRQREIAKKEEVASLETYKLQPNSMQTAFIQSLKRTADDGANRGLLISATGTGKTYASAFGVRDALQPKGKILFVVHRKQILKQAKDSYKNVFGSSKSVGLLTGEDQDYEAIKQADILFAMITMLSKDAVIERFAKDEFSTIVIDEVHHAAADSYQKIMEYFQPDFWLGMTATPDISIREGQENIYEIFDHNIVYEIRLQQALENNLLCPFHYFGISDIAFDKDANADDLIKRAERGDLSVFNQLTSDERVDYVIEQARYYGHSGNRVKGLIFCSSVKEAHKLSEKFNAKGLRTIALSGDDSNETREEAMDRLTSDMREDYLDYILTVNIFNEGVDLPEINQVIMLRPTESAIVFIQQLGRGLRKFAGKEYVVILDFIGNYQNNFLIPIALSGDRTYNKDNIRKYLMEGASVIPGCSTIHFDEVSKQQIYKTIDKASTPRKFLTGKYNNLKNRLGRVPTMSEFYQLGEVDPILFVKNIKGSYYSFVDVVDRNSGLSEFSSKQKTMLDFLSTQICDGKRPHELLIMQELTEHGTVNSSTIRSKFEQLAIPYREEDYNSAIHFLNKDFLNTRGDEARYKNITIFDPSSENSVRSNVESSLLNISQEIKSSNQKFSAALEDVLSYGMMKYNDYYKEGDEDNLVLYQKYSRRDVCRLLNLEKDISSILYGYRIRRDACPIFVTYEKKADIAASTLYEDQFLDPQTFSWMTRNRVSLNSVESQKIINYKTNGLKIYLFVKKSDDEGTDFYYMGRVTPILGKERETTIKNDKGVSLPIMNFQFRLEHPVRNDIYDYFVR